MARVAVAYVEVRPDTKGFSGRLKTALEAMAQQSVKVAMEPDTKGFEGKLKAQLADLDVGTAGAGVAKAVGRSFGRELDKQFKTAADRSSATFLRQMARRMKGAGQVARVISIGLTGIAGAAQSIGNVTSKSFALMGESITAMIGPLGQAGGMMSKFGGQLASSAAAVGEVVTGVVSLAAVAAIASTVVAALNLVLGALLAVVIPLVAGITALVAELGALAGVGVGAIGLLPGALAAAAAAFGPLLLVAERFQDLFEDTTTKTGALFVAMERLKNAIWAVLGTGFVQQILVFAKTVLPQLLGGIEAVSSAWGRLLTGLVRLASTQGVITTFNLLLTQGAQIVNLMARSVTILAPALLSMVTAAQPALTLLLGSVQGLVTAFADWIAQVNQGGQMTVFFNTIAVIIGQIAQILPPLATLMTTWFVNLLGPVTQFVGLLQAMVDRWVALATSAQGMALIQNFFLAMNAIVSAFEPLLEQVVTSFLQFGPTLAALTQTAVPALQVLIGTLMNLATAVAPAVMTFLNAFTVALADPAVQAAVTQLGLAFGELIGALTAGAPMFQSVIQFITLLIRILNPIIKVLMVVLDVLTPLINLIAAVLVPVLDVVLRILQPVLGVLEWLAKLLNKAVEPTLKAVTWALEKLVQGLQWFWDSLVKSLRPLEVIGEKLTWLGKKMGITGGDAKTMATNANDAANKMVGGLNGVANAKAWNTIATNQQAIGQYAVDAANNGISANEQYINSLNAMGAAAYSAKNEVDQATFEKNVGRAMNKQFRLQRATAKSSSNKIGTVAGDAFMDGYNSSVATKFDVATKKSAAAGKLTAAGFISNFKAELSKLSSFTIIKGDTAYDTGKEIARYIAKGITSGKKNIDKVAAYISKHYGTKLTQMVGKNKDFQKAVKANAKALPGFTAEMKKFTTGAQLDAYLAKQQQVQVDLLNNIKDFKNRAIDTLTKGADLVGYFGFIPTPAEIKARLEALKKQMLDFTSGLTKLRDLGLNKELAAQWLAAGPEQAGNLVKGLEGATKAEIDAINASFTSIGTEAKTAANAASDSYFGVGQATVEGYIKGIQSMRKIAGSEMTALIDYVYKETKKKLGIKSPSQVYAGLGVNTMAGYVQGVAGMQKRTVASVDKVMDAVRAVPAADLRPPRMRIPTAPNRALGDLREPDRQASYIKVFVGDREITDIVRVEQQRIDETRARALYAGRKGF